MKKLLALVLVALLAGCAAPTTQRVTVHADRTDAEARKQLDLVVEEMVAERARLDRIYWQLATRNVHLCHRISRLTGIHAITAPKNELGEALRRTFGVSEEPTIVSIVPGGPADRAGLKVGDVIERTLGLTGKEPVAIAERLRASDQRTRPVPMQIRRQGKVLNVELEAVPGCDYPASVTPDQALNAYADGERIYVTRGMMAFARTDDELALVVAHEIGHNLMRHIDAKKTNAAAGMIGDLALSILTRGAYRSSSITQAAASSHSQEFEAEADYVGLYMLANSGYSTVDAPRFWRRMGAASPGNIKGSHGASHPSTAYRMVALEEAAKEIAAKKQSGQVLTPQRKDGKPFVAGEGLLPSAAGSQ